MCTGLEVALLGGMALSATGTLMQGYQNKEFMDFQAGQDEQQAKGELAAADLEAQNIRKALKQQIGAARAAYGASGVQADGATPQIVERDMAEAGETDAMLALLGGSQRATALRQQAGAYRRGGKLGMLGAGISAGGTLLEGAYEYGKGWKRQGPAISGGGMTTSASGASANLNYGNYA